VKFFDKSLKLCLLHTTTGELRSLPLPPDTVTIDAVTSFVTPSGALSVAFCFVCCFLLLFFVVVFCCCFFCFFVFAFFFSSPPFFLAIRLFKYCLEEKESV